MWTPESNHNNQSFEQIFEQILEILPAQVAYLIRLGSIPHRLTPDILMLLADDEELANSLADILGRLSLISKDDEGGFVYHTQLRAALRQQWRLHANSRFAETNIKLYQFFTGSGGNQSTEASSNEREAFYHLLQFNPDEALADLRERFEQLVSTSQAQYAEQFVNLVDELRDEINVDVGGWIDYWQARIALRQGHQQLALAVFEEGVHTPDPLLNALSRWGIGLVHLANNQWCSAIGVFHKVLTPLKILDEGSLFVTRVYLSLGDAYCDFAETSGWVYHSSASETNQILGFWDGIEHLPFTLFGRVARWIDWLPVWYMGFDYQNWIVYYLLRQARIWYHRAEKSAGKIGDGNSQFEAQQMIARLELEIGRPSRAMSSYQKLLSSPQVQVSKYRTAQAELGIGLAHQNLGNFDQAESTIKRAITIFEAFRSYEYVGRASKSLGDLYVAKGHIVNAIHAYMRSVQTFSLINELLKRTSSLIALEHALAMTTEEGENTHNARMLVSTITERAYLSRFPNTLLKTYQRMSVLIALPVSLVALILLTILFVNAAFAVEGGIRLWLIGEPLTLVIWQSIIILMTVVIGYLGVIWSYRLLNAYIGRTLVTIEREPLTRYIVNADNLEVLVESKSQTIDHRVIPWSNFKALSSVTYARWKSPIGLYSGVYLSFQNTSGILIPALTTHYQDLLRAIQARLDASRQTGEFWFSIFKSWSTLFIWGAALVISILRVFSRQLFDSPSILFHRNLGPGHPNAPIWLTTVTFFFVVTFYLLFQAILMWRLYVHQIRVQKELHYQSQALPPWVILILAFISTLIFILWMLSIWIWIWDITGVTPKVP